MRFDQMGAADLAEISRRGGEASGEARRAKRRAIEQAKVEAAACAELRRKLAESHHREAAVLAAASRALRIWE
jgi:hypothetical protein